MSAWLRSYANPSSPNTSKPMRTPNKMTPEVSDELLRDFLRHAYRDVRPASIAEEPVPISNERFVDILFLVPGIYMLSNQFGFPCHRYVFQTPTTPPDFLATNELMNILDELYVYLPTISSGDLLFIQNEYVTPQDAFDSFCRNRKINLLSEQLG